MRKIFLIFVLILSTTACKQQEDTSQQSASATNFQPGSCSIGKWPHLAATPLNIKLSSEFQDDFSASDMVGGLNPIEQMAKVWNDAVSPSMTLIHVPFDTASKAVSNTTSLSSFKDNEFGIYKSHAWFSDVSSGALAITQYYGLVKNDPSLGTYVDLTHADIIVNYRDYGDQFSMSGNSFISYDLPTILLHEMGHFLGLCHESNYSSIMAPYYISTQRSLKTFDTNKIRSLYLNNKNYVGALSVKNKSASSKDMPAGTPIKGIVELRADGKCRHYVNGKLEFEHQSEFNLIKN